MVDFTTARRKMVDSQLRTSNVTHYGVLAAMGEVPREDFVPAAQRSLAYIDEDLLLKDADAGEPARYLTRPAPFARLVQLVAPEADDVALLVGAGGGYGAAVLAKMVSAVVALECDEELAKEAGKTLDELGIDNAAVVVGPLQAGWPGEGPYDVILVDGAVDKLPDGLLDQLKDDGRLVAVEGHGLAGKAIVYTRSDDEVSGRLGFNLALRSLPGFEKEPEFTF
ncbi:protein-L-isoaspartate(D-aspartate) O-methyltransferase [Rhodobium orientis]|uniref:Protein-L-isoaspartate O-methyltransferase n=1 Tax=Rhodobium orientis TaxID=34017 RepID=A0A327JUE9_9HYPH|nr:protein-L-isoaspartate O-methyltransferase [Rhodobium orientis]MBB4302575.1 protein-L-isoaspartate(D-aspartate) O-methyltransferase [Rhodobium orientis]MBK5949423.1 protein-L-isoaspartate O-methyltransferase [Rhodobium orientis]RAI29146.1 protein-L-isoaspartate O-methyltransferase [Rhodobium orientis]